MPALRASIGERKCTGLPSSRISPASGMTAPAEHLDQRRLAGAVVADDAEDLARHEIEIGVVERGDAAVALDEAARLENRLDVCRAHADTFLIHWSSVTATMISTPTVKSCHRTSRPDKREAVAEDADDQRADQRADDRAAAAEQAGAADHHGGDRIEIGGLPGLRADPADAADQHPGGDRADQAGDARRPRSACGRC